MCYDFKEISFLYKEVKQIVLLAENINEKKEVILSSINEMRNAFDHLMRCYDEENIEKCNKQIEKSKGHLFRAGYDSYELIAIETIKDIKLKFQNYSPDVILQVFPNYYNEIVILIDEFEKNLAKVRSNKKIGYDFYDENGEINTEKIEEAFSDYESIVTKLLDLKDEVTKKIPSLEKAKKEIKQTKFKEIIIASIVSAIFGAIISLIITK